METIGKIITIITITINGITTNGILKTVLINGTTIIHMAITILEIMIQMIIIDDSEYKILYQRLFILFYHFYH